MPQGPAEEDAKTDDPWLRAALRAPAGPAAGPAAPTPPEPDASEPPAPEPPAPEPDAPGRGRPEAAEPTPPAEAADAPDPSAVRRLAVQALYVLGNDPDASEEQLTQALDEPFDDEDEPGGHADHPEEAKQAAVALARAAWAGHAAADAAVVAQVPAWPTRRQPPVDRAILRLGHHELVTQRAPFAVVIDEAVELAKAFGEDRTPGFVNAVLDALARGAAPRDPGAGDTGEVKTSAADHPTSGALARRAKRDRFQVRKAEMAAKIGPKHPRKEHPRKEHPREELPRREPDETPAPAADTPAAPPEAEPADGDTPKDPWAAAAARRG